MPLPPPRGAPYRIAFVCLGNICRSPMADVVLSHLVDDAGLAGQVEVNSCGTGDWHLGQPMDPRAAMQLLAEGYDASRHRARQFDPTWLDRDLVLAMDTKNLAEITGGAGAGERVRMFRSFDPLVDSSGGSSGDPAGDPTGDPTGDPALDVPDPFYGGDAGFAEVIAIVERTCRAILTELQSLDL